MDGRMIESDDLTVGNNLVEGVVSTIRYKKGVRGCDIIKDIFDSSGGKFYPNKELTPIEITKERLEKMGFKKFHLFNNCYEKDEYYVFLDKGHVRIEQEGINFGNFIVVTHCNYIHELQNIWKTLKKEELYYFY